MKISIGCDHAGLELKNELGAFLKAQGHEIKDCGTFTKDSIDYPDFGKAVARDVAAGTADFGVLVCWSGVGMTMAANKVKGVRAVNCFTVEMAELSGRHNNANVIAFGQKFIAPAYAKDMLAKFLSTGFDGGRHERRVNKIEAE